MTIRATPALVRAIMLGALLGAAALFLGQPGAAVLSVPFWVYAVWALLSRPAPPEVGVSVSPALVAVRENDSVSLQLAADQPMAYSAVAWPLRFGLALDPADGAVVDAGSRTTVVAEPRTWGRYQVGPAEVAYTDASGAWRAAGTGPSAGVVVRPVAAALLGSSGVAQPIGISGSHRSRVMGDGSDLADLREFRPGDRLRRVNWRVTSRTGRLHVNETHRERDTDVLIVLDTLHDVPGESVSDATSLDLTVRAVASIARHYIGFGDRLAVHDMGRRMRQVRSGSGRRQLELVIDALSRIERKVAPAYSSRAVPGVSSGTLVFFCSPFVDDVAVAELGRLRRQGAEVVAIDTLPETVGAASELKVRRTDRSYLREAWTIRRLERDTVFARLRTVGVPVVPWRGTGSLAGVLLAMEAARRAPRLVRR